MDEHEWQAELILKMTEKNPFKRPTVQEMLRSKTFQFLE